MKKIITFALLTICLAAHTQEIKKDSIYAYEATDVKPTFNKGGLDEFRKFVAKNFNIPVNLPGKVKVIGEFVIEKDGTLSDIKITTNPGYGTGEELQRVLIKSPKWVAGQKDGLPVRTKYKFPVNLQIGN